MTPGPDQVGFRIENEFHFRPPEVAPALADPRPSPSRPGAALGLAVTLLVVGVTGPPVRAAEPPREVAARTIHLLEYVAVDYPAAVRDGRVVNELEYREQLEFAAQVALQLDALGLEADDPLRGRLAALETAVRERASADAVAEPARSLAGSLRERFGVAARPPRPPSLGRGRDLYAEACGSCHGADGRGDGPAARGLDPPPSDFTDRERMLALSPAGLYATVTYGVEGTAMAGYADRFDAASRHDLAFFVGSLAFTSEEVARGRALVEGGDPGVRLPDLATLTREPVASLATSPRALAAVAYLRTHPQALQDGLLPLDLARERLAASGSALRKGERDRALALAIEAYLDGFEHVEPALDAVDGELRAAIEAGFLRYRSLLRAGQDPARTESAWRDLDDSLAAAQARLEGGGLGARAAFVGSLVIAAREGLEAVLLVVALCTVLIRTERRDALRWVHGGWIAALAAGAVTWILAQQVVRVSGAGREVIEGVTSLLATAMLFYVSYWLVSKTESVRWQAFLHGRMRQALSRGSLWTLAGVSFVAVYREAFETVLFYQALFAQAGPEGVRPIGLGMLAGLALLAILGTAVFRFGLRMPLRRFFTASSALLYALAVVLAGHGIASLQEANWLPATWVPSVRVEWLGVHPTLEGLGVQLALLGLGAAALWLALAQRRPAAQQPAGSL